jgi:hypothetical protein
MKDHHKLKGFWILVALTTVSTFFVNLPLSPSHEEITTVTEIVFRALGPSSTVLVDDNSQFSTPERHPFGAVVSLTPGKYYWKASGMSLVSSFTIVSEVALEIAEQEGDKYAVENTGTVPLDVKTKQKGLLTGAFIVDAGKKLTLSLEEETVIEGAERNEP